MILTILRILFLRLRNNPLELLLVFVMPVIFFTIFAGIFSNGIATGSDKKLRIGWMADRDSILSSELKDFLESTSALQCSSLTAESSEPADAQKEALSPETINVRVSEAQRSGRYDLIVRLPSEFPDTLPDIQSTESVSISLVTDGQNPMAVSVVTSAVRGFFAQKKASLAGEQLLRLSSAGVSTMGFRGPLQGEPKAETFSSGIDTTSSVQLRCFAEPADVSEVFRNDPKSDWLRTDADGLVSINGISLLPRHWLAPPPAKELSTDEFLEIVLAERTVADRKDEVTISVENPQAESQENPRIAMYAAGIAVLFLLFSSTGNAAALLEEAESGTLDRILVSQAGLISIIGGKWLGILVLGCLQITVMFVWAEAIFRIQLVRHLPGFCIMTFSTAAATASFAMLLATVCRSRAQLNAVSVVVILSMSAVGGSMIPRFAMSERMKEIGQWTFNAWALDGYQKVFWFQSPITSLSTEIAVLLGSSFILGLLTLMLSGRWKRG